MAAEDGSVDVVSAFRTATTVALPIAFARFRSDRCASYPSSRPSATSRMHHRYMAALMNVEKRASLASFESAVLDCIRERPMDSPRSHRRKLFDFAAPIKPHRNMRESSFVPEKTRRMHARTVSASNSATPSPASS